MSNGHTCKNTNDGEWMHCNACNGRVHLPECTSKRNRLIDCCEARHAMLASQGQTVGLSDSSQPMLPWS